MLRAPSDKHRLTVISQNNAPHRYATPAANCRAHPMASAPSHALLKLFLPILPGGPRGGAAVEKRHCCRCCSMRFYDVQINRFNWAACKLGQCLRSLLILYGLQNTGARPMPSAGLRRHSRWSNRKEFAPLCQQLFATGKHPVPCKLISSKAYIHLGRGGIVLRFLASVVARPHLKMPDSPTFCPTTWPISLIFPLSVPFGIAFLQRAGNLAGLCNQTPLVVPVKTVPCTEQIGYFPGTCSQYKAHPIARTGYRSSLPGVMGGIVMFSYTFENTHRQAAPLVRSAGVSSVAAGIGSDVRHFCQRQVWRLRPRWRWPKVDARAEREDPEYHY